MRDELLSIRTDLQALPRHQVGHDLARRRDASLSCRHAPDPSSRSAPATDPTTASENSFGSIVVEWWNRGSQGRRFLWPALAVAAALAILVFDARQRPTEFEVAQAPEAAPAELQEEARPARRGLCRTAEHPGDIRDADAPGPVHRRQRIPTLAVVLPCRCRHLPPNIARLRRSEIKATFSKAMPESAPAHGAPLEAAPTNAPAPPPKVSGALYDKRAELAAAGAGGGNDHLPRNATISARS